MPPRLDTTGVQCYTEPSKKNSLKVISAVLCDQITTINKFQLKERIGILDIYDMEEVEKALLLTLDIDL